MVQRYGEFMTKMISPTRKKILLKNKKKTHLLLCKQPLGVKKQCQNVAAGNEPGGLSLKSPNGY